MEIKRPDETAISSGLSRNYEFDLRCTLFVLHREQVRNHTCR